MWLQCLGLSPEGTRACLSPAAPPSLGLPPALQPAPGLRTPLRKHCGGPWLTGAHTLPSTLPFPWDSPSPRTETHSLVWCHSTRGHVGEPAPNSHFWDHPRHGDRNLGAPAPPSQLAALPAPPARTRGLTERPRPGPQRVLWAGRWVRRLGQRGQRPASAPQLLTTCYNT